MPYLLIDLYLNIYTIALRLSPLIRQCYNNICIASCVQYFYFISSFVLYTCVCFFVYCLYAFVARFVFKHVRPPYEHPHKFGKHARKERTHITSSGSTYERTYTHTYVHYIHACIHYIRTYIHKNIHKYIHTCIHTR